MLKPYDDLIKIDVTPYCDKRDKVDYLNWAKCVKLLHDNGAEEVWFSPMINEKTGSSLFMTEQEFKDKNGNVNRCYEVGVHIHIDDKDFDYRVPLMNGSNPVKNNSMSQQRVWNCQTRAFVKGVAVHTGLGFNLWVKNETEEQDIQLFFDNNANHDTMKVRERIQEKITALMEEQKLTIDEVATKAGLATADDLKHYLSVLKTVVTVEHNIDVARARKNDTQQ